MVRAYRSLKYRCPFVFKDTVSRAPVDCEAYHLKY